MDLTRITCQESTQNFWSHLSGITNEYCLMQNYLQTQNGKDHCAIQLSVWCDLILNQHSINKIHEISNQVSGEILEMF